MLTPGPLSTGTTSMTTPSVSDDDSLPLQGLQSLEKVAGPRETNAANGIMRQTQKGKSVSSSPFPKAPPPPPVFRRYAWKRTWSSGESSESAGESSSESNHNILERAGETLIISGDTADVSKSNGESLDGAEKSICKKGWLRKTVKSQAGTDSVFQAENHYNNSITSGCYNSGTSSCNIITRRNNGNNEKDENDNCLMFHGGRLQEQNQNLQLDLLQPYKEIQTGRNTTTGVTSEQQQNELPTWPRRKVSVS